MAKYTFKHLRIAFSEPDEDGKHMRYQIIGTCIQNGYQAYHIVKLARNSSLTFKNNRSLRRYLFNEAQAAWNAAPMTEELIIKLEEEANAQTHQENSEDTENEDVG